MFREVFQSNFKFRGYFGHILGLWDILVIFRFRGYFGHFLGFVGISSFFRFWGYFGHFLGLGGILVILSGF